MTRFIRNLLAVVFALVGVFAIAVPADAKVAPNPRPYRHTAWAHPQFRPATWPTPADWQRAGSIRYRGPWPIG